MPPPKGSGTPITRYREKKKNNPSLVGLLAEGDSWFAFPPWLRTNVVEELITKNDGHAAWLLAGANGDEARQIMSGSQYEYLLRIFAEEKLSFDGILFSGGGNDIVGRCLLPLLNQFKDGMTWLDCVNVPRFERRLEQIECAYRELADLRDDYQPQAYVFTHGYDYAIPAGEPVRVLFFKIGPWIKQHMVVGKGITDEIYHKKIIDFMLSRFDDMQVKLEQALDRWVYVRTQGTLKNSEWKDELHPTTAGFKKIADKFQSALAKVWPNLPQP